MENIKSIVSTMLVLTASAACCADNPLDEAGKALARGEAEQAAVLYQRANTEQPTAEGYNNLGVALERSGSFADAARAYRESLRMPHAGNETMANLRRARLRAAIQVGLPYTAWVFFGLFGVITLTWLARLAKRVWRSWRFRMKFWGVRVSSLKHQVQCRDGEYQPDHKVYGDSESLSIKAEIALPDRQDIYPLQLELQVIRPDGTTWRTFQECVAAVEADQATIWFQVDQLGELLVCSGAWRARLVLQNINKHLASTTFAVVTRDDLIADLKVVAPRLIAIKGDEAVQENVIFSDVEAIVPRAVIRTRHYHPSKFAGFRLRLDLVNVDKSDDVESLELPLELTNGAMEFCSISRPVAGDELARKVGKWEFRLTVEGRTLARLPFVITSFEQALESLKLESFEVAGVHRSGQPARLGTVAYVGNVRSLCPVATVTSRFPSRRIDYHMIMAVCVDGEPVGGAEGRLVMNRTSVELVPGEFKPPRIPEGHDHTQVSFVLIVEGRTLGIREVALRLRPPRCADSQGRIADPPPAREIDYDSEASRILGDARVAA